MKRDYEQAQGVVQVVMTMMMMMMMMMMMILMMMKKKKNVLMTMNIMFGCFDASDQRMKEMDAMQELRASERINSYRQQQQR
jgi:hypothetical protein